MNVREKMVELLKEAPYNIFDNKLRGMLFDSCIAMIADHLIAHGVTVQEWVSVDDRLPEIPEGWAETPEPVLYMMKNTKTIYAGYYGEGGIWRDKYFRQYTDSRNGVDADDVLC